MFWTSTNSKRTTTMKNSVGEEKRKREYKEGLSMSPCIDSLHFPACYVFMLLSSLRNNCRWKV